MLRSLALALALCILCAFALPASTLAEDEYRLSFRSAEAVNYPFIENVTILVDALIDGNSVCSSPHEFSPDGLGITASEYPIEATSGDVVTFTISDYSVELPAGYTCTISPTSFTLDGNLSPFILLTFTFSKQSPNPNTTTNSAEPYADPAPPPEGQPAIVTGVRTLANVRAKPSLDAAIVGQVSPDEHIRLLRWSPDGQWCLILHNGEQNQGWLYYRFIKAL